MRNLIFITGSFPWGYGEAFIESEFPFLSKSFDRIWIISNETPNNINRIPDEKYQVLYFPYQLTFPEKRKSVRYIFTEDVRGEIYCLLKNFRTGKLYSQIATLLSSYLKGIKLSDFIFDKIIKSNNLQTKETWVYSYWLNDMATGIALLKKKHPDIKAFSRAHRWDVYPEQSPIHYLPLRKFLGAKLDMIFAISEHGAATLKQAVGQVNCDKIYCIPLGVNGHDTINTPSDEKILTIVSCSSLIKRKRIDKIIKGLCLIEDIQISWQHLGSGDEESNLLHLANDLLSSKKNIRFSFRGAMLNKEIINFYSTNPIDLFINSSEDEGIPVSIMEAFSFGIPAIAPDVGGINEIIDTNINGYLMPAYTDESIIAKCILEFYKLPVEKKQLMRRNAFLKWENNFNAESNYRKFIDKISEM